MTKENNRAGKITLWLSFGVLGAAIIAALIIFFLPAGNSTDKPDVAATASPAPASSTPTADAGGIGCKAPASDNRKVPTDLRWAAVEGITWPVSDSTGPTTTTDGFAACFEHSPVGAALAATTFLYSQVERTPLDTTEFYVADSPGKDVLLKQLQGNPPSEFKESVEENGVAVVGFQVEEYDDSRAMVRVVLRFPGSATGQRGLPFPMVWADGDWKVKPLDTGSTGQATDVGPTEYTPWTAVGNG
jgi:hypothetical protein